MKRSLLLIIAIIASSTGLYAQSSKPATKAGEHNEVSVLFGLNQPIVFHGFNTEINYWTRKWVFDYSHGFGLKVEGNNLADIYKQQHLKFNIAHSLGFGFGYRFTKAFNLRFEPKVHFYEAYYDDQDYKAGNRIHNFSTYTLGLGAYYRWQPFEKSSNALRGITISPSVRYWYKTGSSLGKDGYTYANAKTQSSETLKAPNIGLGNTPFVANISIGYTF